MFKIFPATLIYDKPDQPPRKVPLIKGWKENATNNPEQIEAWKQEFGDRIKFWAVPTGTLNGILVLDVDVKGGGTETILKYRLPLTMSQKTLSGGQHFIFKYPSDGRTYGNRVGFDEGLDIRGEGGYIAYYGVDQLPISDAPDWLIGESLSILKEKVNPENVAKVSQAIVNQICQEALDNIRFAPEGESNNILNLESFRLGQLVASGSLDKEWAETELFRAAKERGKPDYEAKATIESGLKGGGLQPITSPFSGPPEPYVGQIIPEAPVAERWTPKPFTRYELRNTSKLRKPQLFKDWSTEDIHITTADGGTGKTTLKLYEAVMLALGQRFLGFENKQAGKTLFITGEDTAEKLGAMLGVILKQMGVEGKDEEEIVRQSVFVKKDADICIVTKDKQGFLTPSKDAMTKVMQAVEDIEPKMIVFDPIASFWGSEAALNDMAKAVAKFLSNLVERSGACVEVINHMGKQSSSNKDMTQFAGRGGTGLPSHSRVSRVLRPVFDEEYNELVGMGLGEDESAMMCNVNKFTDGSPIYNKPFLIKRKGYLFSRVTLTDQKVKEEQEKMTDIERVFTFIKSERQEKRHPTKEVIVGTFGAASDKISRERVGNALGMLKYTGHMGEKIKEIANPDIEVGGKVFVITDEKGREL